MKRFYYFSAFAALLTTFSAPLLLGIGLPSALAFLPAIISMGLLGLSAGHMLYTWRKEAALAREHLRRMIAGGHGQGRACLKGRSQPQALSRNGTATRSDSGLKGRPLRVGLRAAQPDQGRNLGANGG